MAIAVELCGGPTKVAAALRCSAQAVCFWRDGRRRLPVEHIPLLERLSANRVRRWDFRPLDWWDIWPELIGAEGAPPVPPPDPMPTKEEVRDAA